ncbi:hypothetical protein Syn7502_03611 (plasmid) [Synechococcus sp. PCC 7502]|uniref:AbiTii domain-containing protein n=1 Tax=Synechococcus sp. PCC 7502 TaxID=1173263 RepID=UPI00029FD84A|nr:hypothetical protein [Synechococcus sp. PCC 7502]AFY75440.1 hypothetical protein Syn7502_03611 [Synechococcus sp. PCC 7502]
MSYLVLDLQKEALDPSISTLSLLRKALLVATKLKLEDFKEWINSELNGYQNMLVLPEYRHLKGLIEYHLPSHGWRPIVGDDQDEIFESLQGRSKYLYSAISDLEILFNQSKNLQVRDAPELERKIYDFYSIDLKIMLCIMNVSIGRILETIRNTILRWSLELEEKGILGEGMTFSQQEKESAAQHKYEINNIIQNFYATVGAVQTGRENTANVNQTIISNNSEILQEIATIRK